MKKIFAFFLSVLMTVTCIEGTVFAAEEDMQGKTIVYSTTAEERDRIYEAEIERIMSELNENNLARGPKYHYKSENLPSKDQTVSGLAGNQTERGYKIGSGGSLYYSDSGGPSISGSVAVPLPSPFNYVSFSVNLGNRSEGVGMIVNVPNNKDYFKVWVDKTVEVRPYVVYRKRSGMEGEWEVDHCGTVPVVVAIAAKAVKVKWP